MWQKAHCFFACFQHFVQAVFVFFFAKIQVVTESQVRLPCFWIFFFSMHVEAWNICYIYNFSFFCLFVLCSLDKNYRSEKKNEWNVDYMSYERRIEEMHTRYKWSTLTLKHFNTGKILHRRCTGRKRVRTREKKKRSDHIQAFNEN